MSFSFLVAVAGTALGAVIAVFIFGGSFGDDAWKLAGVMTGTYSGGSLNFVAVGRELDLPQSLFTAATAADNVVTALWFAATMILPVWLYKKFPRKSAPSKSDPEDVAHPVFGDVSLKLVDICILLALGLIILTTAEWISTLVPAIPTVLWLTTLSLLVGLIPAVRALSGAMQLGSIALHFFFALIGIGSKISEILAVGPAIFYLTLTVVLVHGLLLYGVTWLRRGDWDTASVASQAAVGGPSTALALAVAREKPALALPGAAVALLGYALGTYAGFSIAWLMQQIL